MEIGEPRRIITIEPIEEPLPRRERDEPAESEPGELPVEPEKVTP